MRWQSFFFCIAVGENLPWEKMSTPPLSFFALFNSPSLSFTLFHFPHFYPNTLHIKHVCHCSTLLHQRRHSHRNQSMKQTLTSPTLTSPAGVEKIDINGMNGQSSLVKKDQGYVGLTQGFDGLRYQHQTKYQPPSLSLLTTCHFLPLDC